MWDVGKGHHLLFASHMGDDNWPDDQSEVKWLP